MLCGAISEHGGSLGLAQHDSLRKWKGERSIIVSFSNTHLPSFATPNRSCYRLRAAIPKAGSDGGFMVADEMSFYQLLGISERGSFSEIKQAYKQLARKYHPDVSPSDKTQEYTNRFIQVQEAYETLSDPHRRALYDRDLAKGLHFAFSARKQSHRRRAYDDQDGLMARSEWKNNWEDQLSDLKRKSMNKDTGNNLSWAAQMRRKKEKSIDS